MENSHNILGKRKGKQSFCTHRSISQYTVKSVSQHITQLANAIPCQTAHEVPKNWFYTILLIFTFTKNYQ